MSSNKKTIFKTAFCGIYSTQVKTFNNLTSVNQNNTTNNSIVRRSYPIVLQKQFNNNAYFSKIL